jgi:hypothetical protein
VLPASFGDAPLVAPPPRMNRSGLYAYRARALAASTAAIVTAGCGSTLDAGSSDAATDTFVSVDSSTSGDASPLDSSPGADVTIGVLYGFPAGDATFPEDASTRDAEPPDASKDDATTGADAADHDVGVLPPYGIAPAYGLPNP